MAKEIPPMPEGFIDPHAPDAEQRLERLLNTRLTRIAPGVFHISNPGDDERMRERFGNQLRERADRIITGSLGEPYEPALPVTVAYKDTGA